MLLAVNQSKRVRFLKPAFAGSLVAGTNPPRISGIESKPAVT
jgi:hypothetical protein